MKRDRDSEGNEVVKNEFGFYEFPKKPTNEELTAYYSEKYYQTAAGSYAEEYSTQEIEHAYNKIKEKVFVVEKFLKLDEQCSVVDIGCGEGWTLDYFQKRNIPVTGLDFSSFGCEKFNPECLKNFVKGDIYDNIDKLIHDGVQFDLVWLDNVLEHVVDPLKLLQDCKKLMKEGGVFIVEVPNDFSVLQTHLVEAGDVKNKGWLAYPDHLSYFNREGLKNIGEAAGLKEVFAISDYPTDISLMNPATNYYRDSSVGKGAYQAKLRIENFLHSISMEKSINLYKALLELGLGRGITMFFKKEN